MGKPSSAGGSPAAGGGLSAAARSPKDPRGAEKPVDPKSQNGARSRAKGRAQLTLRVRPPVSVIRTTYLCPPGNQKCYQRDIFDPVIVEIPHSLNYFHSDRILIRNFLRPFLFLVNFAHFKKYWSCLCVCQLLSMWKRIIESPDNLIVLR